MFVKLSIGALEMYDEANRYFLGDFGGFCRSQLGLSKLPVDLFAVDLIGGKRVDRLLLT